MTAASFTFTVIEPARLEIRIPGGDIRVAEGAPGEITVKLDGSDRSLGRVAVEQLSDDTVRISSDKRFGLAGGVDVVVAMPADGRVEIAAGSSDVAVDVAVAELQLGAGSGDIKVASVREFAQLKTASGDVAIDDVAGDLQVAVASGDVRVGTVGGDARVESASGDIVIDRVAGRLEGRTAAGDLKVRCYDGDDLRCSALSGDITVGIPPGRTLDVELRTMTGDVINDLGAPSSERTGRASLQIKTMAGDIRLKPAR
jgi:DUF4097 and DUF4098 domain-containing protein YvlB